MFLVYLSDGERCYGRKPIHPHPRKRVAFQIILQGRTTLVVQGNPGEIRRRIEGPFLTVAAPECVHGWSGEREDLCSVLVFQFDDIDPELTQVLGQSGFRALSLPKGEIPKLMQLYSQCVAAKGSPGLTSSVFYRVVAAELTLLLFRLLPRNELRPPADVGERKVAEALGWYDANLTTAPTVEEVARAVHLSSVHLRRLFRKFRNLSPQEAMESVRFERAKGLMRDPAMTLEVVAESSGFGSASDFSRAFKARYGIPPRKYRSSMA